MSVPQEAIVRAILEPHQAAFLRIIDVAWARWLANPEKSQLFRRVRAGLVHNYMMLEAGRVFASVPRIHTYPGQETSFFLVDRRILIRFKKGDERGLSSNVRTSAALAFNDPQEELALGLPDVARVDVAYVLNELETLVVDVLVVARDGERILWSYSLAAAEGTKGSPLIPFPKGPKPPPASSGLRLAVDNAQKKEAKNKK